jgi:uncharacterized protein with HEPN domain
MSRSTSERLRDARSFALDGEYRVLGLDRDTFAEVVEVKYAVYYCLIALGEALKEVPAAVLASEADTPWAAIIAMRNRLVHSYWRIDDDIVYDVATIELPALGVSLERIIRRHEASDH